MNVHFKCLLFDDFLLPTDIISTFQILVLSEILSIHSFLKHGIKKYVYRVVGNSSSIREGILLYNLLSSFTILLMGVNRFEIFFYYNSKNECQK